MTTHPRPCAGCGKFHSYAQLWFGSDHDPHDRRILVLCEACVKAGYILCLDGIARKVAPKRAAMKELVKEKV